MRGWGVLILVAFQVVSCSSIRPVELRPPAAVPPGLIWGYGVEKLRSSPGRARQSAYLKAIDDLLSRGPVLVSKTVRDHTTVLNMRPAVRTLESTFRVQASRIILPSFLETGAEDGFVWVVVGTTEEDIRRGWQQFIEWREQKRQQADRLFREAQGRDRVPMLKASLALLEEIDAQGDPSLLYYDVKAALEAELARQAELKALLVRAESLTRAGQLSSAEGTLRQALELGLEASVYQQLMTAIDDRRTRALALASAGDELFQHGHYGQARERYREAHRLDRDDPQISRKLASAEGYHRAARTETVRATVGSIGWSVSRAIGEYYRWKREEARKEERKKDEEKTKENKAQAESPQPARNPDPPPPEPDPETEEKREELRERRKARKEPVDP